MPFRSDIYQPGQLVFHEGRVWRCNYNRPVTCSAYNAPGTQSGESIWGPFDGDLWRTSTVPVVRHRKWKQRLWRKYFRAKARTELNHAHSYREDGRLRFSLGFATPSDYTDCLLIPDLLGVSTEDAWEAYDKHKSRLMRRHLPVAPPRRCLKGGVDL